MQFIFKNFDVLVDTAALRIAAKGEYKKNLGRLTLEYTNKSPCSFTAFQIVPVNEDPHVKLFIKPLDNNVIQAGASAQQVVNIECVNEFSSVPQVYVQFRYDTLLT